MNVVMQCAPLVLLIKSSITLMLLMSLLSVVRADFVLNFDPHGAGGSLPGECNMPGLADTGNGMCTTAGAALQEDPDKTPFYQARIDIAGTEYWHQIVGDPSTGFAMEVLTPTFAGNAYQDANSFNSPTAGRPSMFPGDLYSTDLDVQSGNGWDPLGVNPANTHDLTGNAASNPTDVIVRQIIGGYWNTSTNSWSCVGNEFCYEFLKDSFDNKPMFTMEINDSAEGMSARVEIDMRAVNYGTDTTDLAMINTLSFISGLGNFNQNEDAQHSLVTAGKYTYTPGDGWIHDGGDDNYRTWDFEEGTYAYGQGDLVGRPYDAGSFDHLGFDWASTWDPYQNPIGPGNEAKCDLGAISGSCPW